MSEQPKAASVHGTGLITLRRTPSTLLMKHVLHAKEATLELGLLSLQKQSDASGEWLRGLKADRIEFGEASFSLEGDQDPMSQIRAQSHKQIALLTGAPQPASREREVHRVVTAIWNIEALSAEQILVFTDRLEFELSLDEPEPETTAPITEWSTPAEQMQSIMAAMEQSGQNDGKPQLIYLSRLSDTDREAAIRQGIVLAREHADRLARAADGRLGRVTYLSENLRDASLTRQSLMLSRQKCMGMLAGSQYELKENEIVSDDPRSVEFFVEVTCHYEVEF